ncbi:MAG: Rrf2 family transcriptional regulator [bacterium]
MHVSVRTLHGIRTVSKMAEESDQVHWNASELAQQKYIDQDYLIQILNQLKDSGIIGSKKGPHGGYYLERSPGDISLGDIIKSLEGPTVLSPCTQPEHSDCEIIEECSTQSVLSIIAGKIDGLLDKITIKDIVEESELPQNQVDEAPTL